MIRLIVNADDYGRSANVSRGILDAHRNGIVTSTTCMMNLPTVVEDIRIALDAAPKLGMGVHLVLTAGAPLLPAGEVPTLVDETGRFRRLEPMVRHLPQIDPAEAQREWRTQIEKFTATTGRRPTHLDSHHHSSYFSEGLFRAMLELAAEIDCPVRLPRAREGKTDWAGLPPEVIAEIPNYADRLLEEFRPGCPDGFYATFYDERCTRAELHRILDDLQEGTFELMVHPGYSDPELIASTIYAVQRDRELEILTDPEIVAAFRDKPVRLITYAELER